MRCITSTQRIDDDFELIRTFQETLLRILYFDSNSKIFVIDSTNRLNIIFFTKKRTLN